jgi:hypothetical protein
MRELGVSRNQVHHHAKVIYRREKVDGRKGLMRFESALARPNAQLMGLT